MKKTLVAAVAAILAVASCRGTSEEERLFSDDFWKDAVSYQNFSDPWDTLTDNTTVRIIKSDDRLFFRFDVEDTSFVYSKEIKEEMDVAYGDRVEVFFSPYPQLGAKYFCTEIDPEGRCLDYSCVFEKKMDYDWSFSTQKIYSRIYDNGYTVITSFDKSETDALIGEAPQYIGLFRADYHNGLPINWYSVAIPDSSYPDFHIPSAFFPLQSDN